MIEKMIGIRYEKHVIEQFYHSLAAQEDKRGHQAIESDTFAFALVVCHCLKCYHTAGDTHSFIVLVSLPTCVRLLCLPATGGVCSLHRLRWLQGQQWDQVEVFML